ncbi:MAG TPA: AAA family ATPase [Nitrospira sp.]|nr:AAA family ATPase [Candidatus Manganitrophaceae bacterium]
MRRKIEEENLNLQQVQGEIKKLNQVVEKVTAPANRIGTLLGLPASDMAHIIVGGADYYTNIDPRLEVDQLLIGSQVLVNEAFVVIKSIGYDPGGAVVKITDLLPDGRLRIGQETGSQSTLLIRSSRLTDLELTVGDEVRTDASHRVAIEKVDHTNEREHFLEEVPTVLWSEIGGQKKAVDAVRERIEAPLLHPELYKKYQFSQPKGFLLYGPPGCGKTLIGKATARSLTEKRTGVDGKKAEACFFHIKGPEILNMWLGESERMVREIFARARKKRAEGYLPFIFIDEAESILGTRRGGRSHNILNTLVPMFCAEMDGIESLKEMVIILASNRPDLIDPAVLRPGRIDRKIKISRPDREGSEETIGIYLTDQIPLAPKLLKKYRNNAKKARGALIQATADAIFEKENSNVILELYLRSGRRKKLYRSDLVSGALIESIVQRSKERAIKRAIAKEEEGLNIEDLTSSVEAEFKEGEILPSNDILDDWLKLVDIDPDNVVGLSLRERKEKEGAGREVI